MSTISTIWINHQGLYSGIRCHWGGKGLAHLLFHEYSEKEKLQGLIDLGNISKLGEEIAPCEEDLDHCFDMPTERVTVAYHRDKGEPLSSVKLVESSEAVLHFTDSNYLWEGEKWWMVDRNFNGTEIVCVDPETLPVA